MRTYGTEVVEKLERGRTNTFKKRFTGVWTGGYALLPEQALAVVLVERNRFGGSAELDSNPDPCPNPSPSPNTNTNTNLNPNPNQIHAASSGGAWAQAAQDRPRRTVKVPPPWQHPGSAPAPPQGAPGGSGRLGTPGKRPTHWTPRHRLGCSS